MKTVLSCRSIAATVLWLSLISFLPLRAQQVNLDSIYQVLDARIAEAPKYIKEKEAALAQLRADFLRRSEPDERYDAAAELYREYRSFDNDSALYYLFQCYHLAEQTADAERMMATRLRIGHQYVVSGYYPEAFRYFQSVRPDALSRSQQANYYHYWSHLYRELESFTLDDAARQSYRNLSQSYRDSLQLVSATGSALYYQRQCIGLCAEGRYDEAMDVSRQWMKTVGPSTIGYSLMAYYRSEIYEDMGQEDLQKYWLAVSAISEIECSDMNLTALWKLAEIMYNEGDLERAMRYIDFSWASISRFSTHKRSWLMAPIMSDIHNDYQARLTARNNQLRLLALVVGLLAIFLLCALFYALRERRIVARSQATLRQAYEQLDLVNSQLLDSNRLKDNYLREFLQMCSTYISKIDNFRSRINRKLHANQLKELIRLTDSEDFIKTERAELMEHFDSVFLRLFPAFVQDFNNLLQPEARIVLKDGESLNTVLRIFALVRLGIDESAKIAEFLNYTPNSIYNYRSRIKASALGERNDFENQVKLIGVDDSTRTEE